MNCQSLVLLRPIFLWNTCDLTIAPAGGSLLCMARWLILCFMAWCCSFSPATGVEVILTGGVALKSWEYLRGPAKHDNWWANFVRASTVHMQLQRAHDPQLRFVWIVYRPAYVTRGREEGVDYVSRIRDTARRIGAELVLVDTAYAACRAINRAGQGRGLITSFVYFGHSNAHAFMLDYSNSIIGSSKQWIHEKDLATRISRAAFAPGAKCVSYGCYTGLSMSSYWRNALGIPLIGNTASTRYQPVGEGRLPVGAGSWKQ